MTQRSANLLGLILLAVLPGCRETEPTELTTRNGRMLGHVVGWVPLDGKPLANAQVDFHNNVTRRCSAGTDENGRYELKFSRRQKGAPVGEHRVAIGLFGQNSEDPADEPLPAHYNKNSILKATVRKGANTISFHLTTPKGASEVAELGNVHGLILLDGNPLPGAQLEFHGDGNNVARGTSDRIGHFELVYTEQRPGAEIGKNRITVSKTDKNGEEILRSVYNSETTLERSIRNGENQVNFSLTTKPLPQQPPSKEPQKRRSNGS